MMALFPISCIFREKATPGAEEKKAPRETRDARKEEYVPVYRMASLGRNMLMLGI
jgi:hypothetical protein